MTLIICRALSTIALDKLGPWHELGVKARFRMINGTETVELGIWIFAARASREGLRKRFCALSAAWLALLASKARNLPSARSVNRVIREFEQRIGPGWSTFLHGGVLSGLFIYQNNSRSYSVLEFCVVLSTVINIWSSKIRFQWCECNHSSRSVSSINVTDNFFVSLLCVFILSQIVFSSVFWSCPFNLNNIDTVKMIDVISPQRFICVLSRGQTPSRVWLLFSSWYESCQCPFLSELVNNKLQSSNRVISLFPSSSFLNHLTRFQIVCLEVQKILKRLLLFMSWLGC